MTRGWLVAALVACSNASAPAPHVDPPPPPHVEPALPAATTQLVTGVIDTWDSTKATLRMWTRHDRTWQPAGEPRKEQVIFLWRRLEHPPDRELTGDESTSFANPNRESSGTSAT